MGFCENNWKCGEADSEFINSALSAAASPATHLLTALAVYLDSKNCRSSFEFNFTLATQLTQGVNEKLLRQHDRKRIRIIMSKTKTKPARLIVAASEQDPDMLYATKF